MKNYIYIYETPESKKDQLIKIGQTKRKDVKKRIKEQINTAAVYKDEQLEYTLLFEKEIDSEGDFNFFKNNENEDEKPFTDHVIHKTLKHMGIENPKAEIKQSSEWFKLDLRTAIYVIDNLLKGKKKEEIDIQRTESFKMRPEQEQAVEDTYNYFQNSNQPYLWNAKMRFGKTFTAYQLMKKLSKGKEKFKTLILTYKPAVEDAWQNDLQNHVDFKEYTYLQRNSLKDIEKYPFVVSFASFQDVIGNNTDIKEKHVEVFKTNWDLLIIDEYHFGAATEKAEGLINESKEDEYFDEIDSTILIEEEIKSIKSKNNLYLSGTPFKALADSKFEKDAIFNWTYLDEQKAKENWIGENNPYDSLATMKFFLLEMKDSLLNYSQVNGQDEFSLNHFFKSKNEKFLNEDDVKNWLSYISSKKFIEFKSEEEELNHIGSKQIIKGFPYEDLNKNKHSFWYLPNVDSVNAMALLLKDHDSFKGYEIISVAGKKSKSGKAALIPVEAGIKNKERTITLSCGKLTTGVSVKEWNAILFLRDITSPESYFQAAFRVQTPWKNDYGEIIKKECYVYDFSPNRTLQLVTNYTESLIGGEESSEEKISEFIKYLPILKMGSNSMVELDGKDILTFNLDNLSAVELGSKFDSSKNISLSLEKFLDMQANSNAWDKAELILNKIKKYKEHNDSIVLKEVGRHANDIKDIVTKSTVENDKEKKKVLKKEEDKERSLYKKKIEAIKERLKTLLARLPLFMYLTNASERNLREVLSELILEENIINNEGFEETKLIILFEMTTGITTEEFHFLVEIGLLKVSSMDGYILKFKEMESNSFNEINEI